MDKLQLASKRFGSAKGSDLIELMADWHLEEVKASLYLIASGLAFLDTLHLNEARAFRNKLREALVDGLRTVDRLMVDLSFEAVEEDEQCSVHMRIQ